MTVLEIIKVVGFATGAALHLYFAWLIWRRVFPRHPLGNLFAGRAESSERAKTAGRAERESDAEKGERGENAARAEKAGHAENARRAERAGAAERRVGLQPAGVIGSELTFVAVGLCLGFWFLGNLLITVQEILLAPGRAQRLLRVWSSIAVIGIALFPSVLLHSHVAFWSWMDKYQTLSRQKAKVISALFYIPMAVLPFTVYWVNTGDYKPYLVKLHWVLVPYSIWFALALWSTAILDWVMKDKLYDWALRERAFLRALAVFLFINGAVEPVVIGVGGAGPNDYLWITFILLSLAPTFTVAYYIYRYNLYE